MEDVPAVDYRPEHPEGGADVRQDDDHDQDDSVDDQPGDVLEDHVLHLMAGGEFSAGHTVMLLWLDLCVDDLDPPGDLPDADSMETDAEDEVVVPLREYFLVEEEVEDCPEKRHTAIEGDGVVLKNGADEADGAELEDAVEEKEGKEVEGLEELFLDGHGGATLVQEVGVYPGYGQHKDGATEGEVLDGRGQPVPAHEDDEELDAELEGGVVKAFSDGVLGGEGGPLGAGVEQGNQVDDEELGREGDAGEDGKRGEEEEEAEVLSEVDQGLFAPEVVTEAEEGPEGEAEARQEEAGESDIAKDGVLLIAFCVAIFSQSAVI